MSCDFGVHRISLREPELNLPNVENQEVGAHEFSYVTDMFNNFTKAMMYQLNKVNCTAVQPVWLYFKT